MCPAGVSLVSELVPLMLQVHWGSHCTSSAQLCGKYRCNRFSHLYPPLSTATSILQFTFLTITKSSKTIYSRKWEFSRRCKLALGEGFILSRRKMKDNVERAL